MSIQSILASLDAWLTTRLAPLDYDALHPGKVVQQNGDGTLEIVPDSPKLQTLSNVPLRAFPGVTIRVDVAEGPRVLVAFEGRDPSKPVAIPAWESPGLTRLTIEASDKVRIEAARFEVPGSVIMGDGLAHVLRTGDKVAILHPTTGVLLMTGVLAWAPAGPGEAAWPVNSTVIA